MAAIACLTLQTVLIRLHGKDSAFARALTSDFRGKVSPVIYISGIALAFVAPRISHALYALVAVMWLVPDKRFERVFEQRPGAPNL